MRHILFLFLVLSVAGSCDFEIKRRDEGLTSIYLDTSHAYDRAKKNDSIKKANTRQLDTAILLPEIGVDTKNVHPEELVRFAESWIGVPYLYGSANPEAGFDCSGFITYVFNHFGIAVPRSSRDFMGVGNEIAVEFSRRGDIILFTGTDSTEELAGHMGIVVSNQCDTIQFIHSTSGKANGVTVTPLNDYYRSRYLKTIRIFPQNRSYN